MGVRDPDKGERERERERAGGKQGEKERWRERAWQGEGRDGRELGTNPGVRVSRRGAQEKADAQRKEREQGGREGIPEMEGAPSTLSRGIRSPRGWEMFELDMCGRGEGGIPQSRLAGVSGLIGSEDPGREKGRQQESNREPRRLSSPPCGRVG